MTTWTDEPGRRLIVLPAQGGAPARLAIAHPGEEPPDFAVFHLDGIDVTDISIELHKATGQAVPVITPRPEVDASTEYLFGPLRMRVSRARGVDVSAGNSSWHYGPSEARQVAGALVALADAAGQVPDPADVDELALVLVEGRNAMGLDGARPLARRILAAGYRREVPGNG